MKKTLLTIAFGFCLILNSSIAQNDYYRLKLKGGSKVFGQLLEKNRKTYRLLTNNSDTLTISKRIIRQSYLIPDILGKGDVVPIFQKGFFYGLQVGNGFEGLERPKLRRLNNYSLDFDYYVNQIGGLVGYQWNPYFAAGIGVQGLHYLNKNSLNFYGFSLLPYVHTKFNYRGKNWKNTGGWLSMDIFFPNDSSNFGRGLITKLMTGFTIFTPKRSLDIGFGVYNSYDFHSFEFHVFTGQVGIQF